MENSEGYYNHVREELLSVMPPLLNSRVLDIGCADGQFGALLKQKGAYSVFGVELNSEAATRADSKIDKVFVGNIEELILPFSDGYFDVIVCADVIEHLVDPWALLQKIYKWLKPTGSLVASIPNIRCGLALGRFLAGRFGYDNEGILDHTHLRFFTLTDIHKMLLQSGFAMKELGANMVDKNEELLSKLTLSGGKEKIEEVIELLTGYKREITTDELTEFFVFQYLIRAEKRQ